MRTVIASKRFSPGLVETAKTDDLLKLLKERLGLPKDQ